MTKNLSSFAAISCCCLLLVTVNTNTIELLRGSEAFSVNHLSQSRWNEEQTSRREWLGQTMSSSLTIAGTTAVLSFPSVSVAASVEDYIQELKTTKSKIQEIPDLLQQQEWDKVRTILKTPPVNYLWNLGDSSNTLLKLAKETGDVDLFEIKDDLAYNLQMCDQLTYDNVFVYFQPGNGKIKIKEPTDFIKKAIQQLDDILSSQSSI
ncbi:hypothetical protein IV203_032010 [Nitzschia inconspicua]|uniref:Uncharacterized protein n=1 Tax=Nitzschia inconspicua TaxID=303405 RepID=A0A9K3Q2X9_9STRA|nr:hypothetical protein IV203_032010 [Nitzschia inconspicua]